MKLKSNILLSRWRWLLAVVAMLALAPRTARAESGSVIVTGGGEVKYTDAAKTEWITNPDGSKEFLLYYTYENSPTGSFELPGTTSARILAIGGGGGGGGTYYWGCEGNHGGGGGGGAGGFFHTNGIFSAATYSVTVGKGGNGGIKAEKEAEDFAGKTGDDTIILCDEEKFITAHGGGGGGGETSGKNGASGGGGSKNNTSGNKPGGTVTNESINDGNLGNIGGSGNTGLWGGGGGGAGSVGKAANTSGGGVGGDGLQSDITLPNGSVQASWPYYAGGGGGGYISYSATSGGKLIAGGNGGGGSGGYGDSGKPATNGTNGLGGGGGGGDAGICTGGTGGSGVVIVRIAGAISGGLERPTDLVYKYDGKEKKSYETSPFYTVTGDNVGTNAGVYVCTVTLKDGFEWAGGGKEPVTVSMTIYDGQYSGTVDVTGAPVSFQGAAETNWVKNAKGGYDFLLKFTGAGTYTLPGTTKARILAIGGGGGGGGVYYWGCENNHGGGGGGGAGGFVETNDMFSAAQYAVGVGAGGAGGIKAEKETEDFTGKNGGNTIIMMGSTALITAYGGGGGGGETDGRSGGSGGGGSRNNSSGAKIGGKGIAGQGCDGGSGSIGLWGGGGGGAGGKGADASTKNPVGGKGRQSDIALNYGVAEDNWTWYAGGGGGSYIYYNASSGSAIAGGKGGGGNGGYGTAAKPTSGEDGTGSGGGGGNGDTCVGGNGGSGVVYVRISAAMEGELVKPEKTIEITYDGNAHTTRVSNVFYDVSGENIATNARDTPYKSTVTLKDGYTWPGGDPESPIEIKMTIKRCPVTISGLTMDSWSFIKDKSKMPDPQYTVTPEWVRPLLRVEYATSKEAPDDQWGKKPMDVGDYWVRVRIPDTENYSGETAYANFKIFKVKVTFSDLFQKDWMAGTPDDATPKPRCTVDPAWVFPDNVRYDYGAVGTDPTKDEGWDSHKPTELGEWAIRIRAKDDKNYDYVPIAATFNIVKGLGNIFTDYVEFEIPALTDGRELTNFPYKVILHETDDAPLAGFLYERAGTDGKEMGATDPFGNVTPYTVAEWKTHGDSVIYVKIPLIASSNQTIRLYWHLRTGATAPGDDPKGTWSNWTKDEVEKTDVPAATFDLVVKDGFRVDYWTTKPTLKPTVWAKNDAPGVLTDGMLADGTYTTVLIDTVTGAPVTFPPKQGGAYRFIFTLDNPDMEYEDLSYHIDFAVTDSLPMDRLQGNAPTLTASGRVFLANDDEAKGHEVSGQSYWRTNPEEQAYYWEHTGTHKAVNTMPNLQRFPGSVHQLNYLDEAGKTNCLWRFEDVILGNTFRNATMEDTKCFLPWSSTGLGTSSDGAVPGTRDESGWMVLRNTTNARVYSPCYTNGIGTIYFDAVNAYAITSMYKSDFFGIEVDFATNVWEDVLNQDTSPTPSRSLDPTDENCYGKDESGTERAFGRLNEHCWHPATLIPLKRDNNEPNFTRQEPTERVLLDIAKGGSTNNFYRICVNLDYRGPIRFRIRRATEKSDATLDVNQTFMSLDNIIVSYPKSVATLRPYGVYDDLKLGKRVVGQEGAMSVPYPSLTDHSVFGLATNTAWVSEVAGVPAESLVMLSRLHYRWRYGDQAIGEWKEVDLSPFDDFKGTVPLDLTYAPGTVEQGDVEFFYESFMRVPFYQYYDYSGANFGLGGLYTEETGTLTNTYADVAQSYARYTGSGSSTNWFFRLRAGQSDWDEISVVLNDGTREWREPMELIGDHTWRALALVTNTTGDVSFKFSGNARRAPWGGAIVEDGTRWDSPVDVDKMPYRGAAAVVTSGTKVPPVFHADAASNYIEFQFDDESGGFTIGHAEYQSFDKWHDAWREDKKFVGRSTAASGVSDAQMITTNAHMRTWPLPKLSQGSWNESFELGDYTDPAYPKYTSKYFLSHKMPHLWTGENGIFVDATLTASNATSKSKSSGIAWQMRGAGAGNVSFTQNDTPSGIDTITFKARLAQTTKLSDFSAWKGGFAEQNYTFVFPALLSANDGTDSSPGATMSLVGYYDPWYGCYEFRIERTDNEGLLFSIYKWAPVDGEVTAKCLGSHWFRGATFLYKCTNGKPETYGMFISVGDEGDGATSIVAGLTKDRGTPNNSFSGVAYRAIACVDSDKPLTCGTFGAICANCGGMFIAPRHYDTYVPKTNLATWKHDPGAPATCYGYVDTENVTFPGKLTNDKELLNIVKNVWGQTPGRAEIFEVDYSTDVQYGIRQPTDLKQTVGVYLKPVKGGSWSLYKEETVSQYGFKDYTVTVRTNENCHVMLQTGEKQSDVTVWQIAQTGWNGENIPNLDSTANDFVYTSAFVTDEVNGKVTNRYTRLQPTRTSPANALSIRSPLLSGLGMIKFWYKDLDPNTEVWVQVATNVVESALPGSDGYNLSTNCVDWGQATKTERDWITVRKYGYDELAKSDLQTYYLGLHFDVNDPQRGAFRIVVPPAKVSEAQKHVKEDSGKVVAPWGAITITDIQVQDEPPIDKRSWLGWNIRTLGDATDSEKRMFISDMPGAGLSGGLNNSYEKDIVGDPSEYDKNDPYVQSPTFGTYVTESGTYKAAIGRIRFRARLYDTNASPARVSVYGVTDGTATDWGEPLATFEVTSPRYVAFEYPTPSEMSYAAIRLVVDGVKEKRPGVNRVLLEEIVVSEKSDVAVGFHYLRPFRSGIAGDLVIEDILAREQQPLVEESWGVQTKLKFDKFGNEVDYERGFRVTFSYYAGDTPWGFENWIKEASAVKEVELSQVGAKDDYVFRSTAFNRASIVPPQRTANAVVQYAVRVYYYEKGGDREMSRTISVSEVEGDGWTNPSWYHPLDYNRVDNRMGEVWKPSVSPYTIIDSIAPGRAWINEVNYNDGMPSENGNVKVVTNQFIEIAVPWGVDMTDWSVRLTDFNRKSIDLAVLGRGGIPGMKKSAKRSGDYDFLVLQSPNTEKAGGIRDPENPGQSVADGTWSGGYLPSTFLNGGDLQLDMPYQIELVRPSGVVEHQFVVAGTNDYRAPIYYPSFGYKYDGTNLVNELNAVDEAAGIPIRRFYAGEDVGLIAPGVKTYVSFGVEGSAHGEEGGWSSYQHYTPGRKNEDQDELTGWFIRPNGESCWVYARVEGEHLSQRIGKDTEPDTFVIVNAKESTNIEYTVANWYQVDKVLRIENGVTNATSVGKEGTFTYTVENVTGTTYIVATEGLSQRVIDAGLDPADRYTPAIMRWLESGVANGRPFAHPDGEIRNATFLGLWSSATNIALNLKSMYVLDLDPTEGGWWLRGGWSEAPGPAYRTWYSGDGRETAYTNYLFAAKLYLSNDVERAGVTRPEVYAPPRLQGPNGERSDDQASYSSWTGTTFKIEGYLPNGMEGNKGFQPFRWFVFGPESFDSDFTAKIELLDPFQSPSIGVSYGWPVYKGLTPWWRFNLSEKMQPVGVDMLNKDSTFGGKPPFVKP